MKKFVCILFVLALFVSSCSKEDLNPPIRKEIIGNWKLIYASYLITKNDTSRYKWKNFEKQHIIYKFKTNGYLTIQGEQQKDTTRLYPYEVIKGRYFLQDTTTPPAYDNILIFGGKRYSVSIGYNPGIITKENQVLELSDYSNLLYQTTLSLKRE